MASLVQSSMLIGCAGWAIPAKHKAHFDEEGSHLERYAAKFRCVEINSSFYRPHQPQTYRRWAATVPGSFQFSVKVPKALTHERRLKGIDASDVEEFLEPVLELGGHLGPLLVQLPPSLKFDPSVAREFFTLLRERFDGLIALEPRDLSWWSDHSLDLVQRHRVAIVAADPGPSGSLAGSTIPEPAGWPGLAYFRLHGSPTMYYSDYPDEILSRLAKSLLLAKKRHAIVWCIFDNTAAGAAPLNALQLMGEFARLSQESSIEADKQDAWLMDKPD